MDFLLVGIVQAGFALLAVLVALRQLRQEREMIFKQLSQERELFLQELSQQRQQLLRTTVGDVIGERREILLSAVNDPDSIKWLLKKFGLDDCDLQAQGRSYVYTILAIDHYQPTYYQYRRGLFPKTLWPIERFSMVESFATPLFKKVWSSSFKSAVNEEFRVFKEAGFPDTIPDHVVD